MKTIFSTSDVHPRHRFAYWHSVACDSIVNHDSVADRPQSFQAQLQSGVVGDMALIAFTNSPMTVSHTKSQAARSNSEELFICSTSAGEQVLEQSGRQVSLVPGDIVLLDPRVAYQGRFLPGSELLVVKVPRGLVEARIGSAGDMLAHSIKPVGGEAALLSSYLTMLPKYVGTADHGGQHLIQDHVLDLFGIALLATAQRGRPRLSSARRIALLKIRGAIESRLSDPDLTAATAAAAAGIGERYANAVLAQEGTSIRRLIVTRRLERCRDALEDPLQSHRTVSDIAYRWGFADMTHFGRAFRSRYGLLPSEFRKRCREGTSDRRA